MRILVIQLRGLSEILLITPLIRRLKALHPHSKVDVFCERSGRQVLAGNPNVYSLMHPNAGSTSKGLISQIAEIRRRKYNLLIDAQNTFKSGVIASLSGAAKKAGFASRLWSPLCYGFRYNRENADYNALDKLKLLSHMLVKSGGSALGGLETDLHLDFFSAPEDKDKANNFCFDYFGGKASIDTAASNSPLRWPVAAINCDSSNANESWPISSIATLADRLSARGLKPFLISSSANQTRARQIAKLVKGSIVVEYPRPELAVLKEILSRCAVYIGVDGIPKYLAALSEIPTVTLFGKDHPQRWTEPNNAGQIVLATCSRSRKIKTDELCLEVSQLNEIPVEAVYNKVACLLDQRIIKLLPTE
jgi:ADP-heptose:LPS heptosyltransferase